MTTNETPAECGPMYNAATKRLDSYRVTAYGRDGQPLYMTAGGSARPTTDDDQTHYYAKARHALDVVDALMPVWSYDYDAEAFVPAFVAYYTLIVPGALHVHAERHVPTSGSHGLCTHERNAAGRRKCRAARR